jgi:hypothetical protein
MLFEACRQSFVIFLFGGTHFLIIFRRFKIKITFNQALYLSNQLNMALQPFEFESVNQMRIL